MDRYERLESKEKRSTKALKKKKTYELNGKMSAKHLRIQEMNNTKKSQSK